MTTLGDKPRRILSFIRDFVEEHGYPPSIRDIATGCHISSTSVVAYNLDILEKGGYIRRDPEVSRGVEVLETRRNLMRVPLMGTIAAGEPIPVPSSDVWDDKASAEAVELPRELAGNRVAVYALKVKGTSMIDALIDDGDIVLMEQAEAAEEGQMVAVWLKTEAETTLKRFFREGERIRLQPANQEMKPIYVDPRNVVIQGRVIGVIRKLG
ncbi:MAG: transcriptional repressor LexA [Chloroflexi bacterium]|nr:transcriptional repressor LexA [Chloroflexota bacterium]